MDIYPTLMASDAYWSDVGFCRKIIRFLSAEKSSDFYKSSRKFLPFVSSPA